MTQAKRAQADSTHQQWIRECVEGRSDAPSSLIRLLTPIVRARIARLLARSSSRHGRHVSSEVDDLSQEFFLRLFSSNGRLLRNWRPERGLSLENYVGLLATRATISTLRSRAKNPWTEEPEDPTCLPDGGSADAPLSERVASRELLERLAIVLQSRLSETGFEMFYRLYVWQQTPHEIGEQTGMRADAVYQWRTRLAQRAREVHEELLQDRATRSDPAGGPRSSERAL